LSNEPKVSAMEELATKEKMGNPNMEANDYIEIKLLLENQVGITYRQFDKDGKSVIISEEKYRIIESIFGERLEENGSTELLRKILNLESHQILQKI
jgi:hypothetical protein